MTNEELWADTAAKWKETAVILQDTAVIWAKVERRNRITKYVSIAAIVLSLAAITIKLIQLSS